MLIHEMTEDECRAALEQVSFGRLACARGDQPYIVPIYFSYDRKHLYGVTTLGQKIGWMRSNPLVCLEIDWSVVGSDPRDLASAAGLGPRRRIGRSGADGRRA